MQIDADDIAGVVRGKNGPEAGACVIAQTTELGTWFAATSLASVMRYCGMPSTAKVRYLAYFSPIFRTCSYAGSFRHARTASTLGY